MDWRTVYIDNRATKYYVSENGMIRSLVHNILLQPCLDTDEYPQVGIYIDGKRFNRKVHRLVAEAFIPNPDGKPEINHKDGNKLNNNVSNLEWCTNQENIDHAIRTGLRESLDATCGSYHVYDPEVIHKICKLLEEDILKQKEIANLLGVPKGLVSVIKCRKNWKEISSQYNIKPVGNGELRAGSIYSNEQVHQVCKLLEENKLKLDEIAKQTGTSKSLVAGIKGKRIWTEISSGYNIPIPDRCHHRSIAKYSDEIIHQVCKLLESKEYSMVDISKKTGVDYSTVSNIKYKHVYMAISNQYNI